MPETLPYRVRVRRPEKPLAVEPYRELASALAMARRTFDRAVLEGDAIVVNVVDVDAPGRVFHAAFDPFLISGESDICEVCGCSDDDPCNNGCAWHSVHLCTECAQVVLPVGREVTG